MPSYFEVIRNGMAPGSATARGQGQARRAANSKAVAAAARAGFVARGVIYVLIGVLSLWIAFFGGGEQADRGGAIAEIAQKPFGTVLLWLLGIALAGGQPPPSCPDLPTMADQLTREAPQVRGGRIDRRRIDKHMKLLVAYSGSWS